MVDGRSALTVLEQHGPERLVPRSPSAATAPYDRTPCWARSSGSTPRRCHPFASTSWRHASAPPPTRRRSRPPSLAAVAQQILINSSGWETRVAMLDETAPPGDLHRARARARHGGQHLQGPRHPRPARYAGGVRRHRAREGGLPARLRFYSPGGAGGQRGHRGAARRGRGDGHVGRRAAAAWTGAAVAPDRGASEEGPGDDRAGGQAANRQQGRAGDLDDLAARPATWSYAGPHHIGVSRRIEDEDERARLREIVEAERPPDSGFIIRTACEGVEARDPAGTCASSPAVEPHLAQEPRRRRRARPAALRTWTSCCARCATCSPPTSSACSSTAARLPASRRLRQARSCRA